MPEEETRVEGFIAMVYHYWGWGATPAEAIARCRKAGGTHVVKGQRLIYQMPLGAIDPWVDDLGAIHWSWADDAPDRTANGTTIEKPKEK